MKITSRIQIGNSKNINSVNVDLFKNIVLENNISYLSEYDINKVIDSNDVFENERENSLKYNIYGRLEFFSLLNGLRTEYDTIFDFFSNDMVGNSKNIHNSFEFYLVMPSNVFKKYNKTIDDLNPKSEEAYIREFVVIATPNEIEIVNAGFNKNIFNEQVYSYVINKTIDLESKYDYLNFPITDVYLYAKYKKTSGEGYEGFNWNMDKYEIITTSTHKNGDLIIGDVIAYDKKKYIQRISLEPIHRITTAENKTNKLSKLSWVYNPFIPIRLRKFSSDLNVVSVLDTRYDIIESIPKYATIENNIAIWRDIEKDGYVDLLSGDIYDHPFINGCKYVFNSNILSITPNHITNSKTKKLFNEIRFEDDRELDGFKPNTNLNEFNRPCK